MAEKKSLAEMTTEELKSKLKTINSLLYTLIVIFTVIVIAWLALGYWKTNLPVFITTICMGVAASGGVFASTSAVRHELKNRNTQ